MLEAARRGPCAGIAAGDLPQDLDAHLAEAGTEGRG
jgi:hypothetical protein